MLRKLFQFMFPPPGQKDTNLIAGILAVWLILISGTTVLSFVDALQ